MANKLLIDCSLPVGQQAQLVPLSPDEVTQAAVDAPLNATMAAALAAVRTNATTLTQRAQTALNANATFLALGASPTTAQVRDQVIALTKECNAVIRLLTNALDSTTGT